MNAQETIKSWRWRIVKAGLNTGQFAKMMGMSPSTFSEYWSDKKKPSIERFDIIESKLQELGV